MDLVDMCLFDSAHLVRRRMNRVKRRSCWVNPIYVRRDTLGEYNHLHQDLEAEPRKYFDYYRMTQETFTYILRSIESNIAKDSNFRNTISPGERLSVTLR